MLKLAMALIAGFVSMGGWAVVTVKDLPEYFVAGQRYTLQFQVRQHGRTLMNNVEPQLVVATSDRTGDSRTIAATRIGDGTYTVTFMAPAVPADHINLTIISGWGASNLSLYPIRVVAAGAPPAPLNLHDRGRMLFIAKGCNSCHANSDLIDRPDNQSLTVGPALGGRQGQLARDYVMQKVKQPRSQIMPDLGLSDAEAGAITAFLTTSPQATVGRASR